MATSLGSYDLPQELIPTGQAPARVVGEERGLFNLATPDKEFLGLITGRLRYLANERLDLPAIGDWVLCTATDDPERAIIHSILPRRTLIKRKQAGFIGGDLKI